MGTGKRVGTLATLSAASALCCAGIFFPEDVQAHFALVPHKCVTLGAGHCTPAGLNGIHPPCPAAPCSGSMRFGTFFHIVYLRHT